MRQQSAHRRTARPFSATSARRIRLALLLCAAALHAHLSGVPTAQCQDETRGTPDRLWVCALAMDSGESRKMFSVTDFESVDAISVSPDGRKIAVAGQRPGRIQTESWIGTCLIDGSEWRVVGRGTMPTWSPRGIRIAFSRHVSEPGVWIMRGDGSDQRIIDHDGQHACWSPDGRRIAYTRRVSNAADLVIFNLVEAEFRAIWGDGSSGCESFRHGIAWSPDSQRLGFNGLLADGESQLAAVDVSGNSAVRLRSRSSDIQHTVIGWRDNETMLTSSVADGRVQINAIEMSRLGDSHTPTPTNRTLPWTLRGSHIGSMDVSGDRSTLYYVCQMNE